MKDEFDLLDDKRPVRHDYVAILVRRRWYIVGPLLICGLLGSILARAWHLPYKSEALILVEQQKVPDQYVTPNVITSLQTRLDAMTQQILSRTRLVALMDEFNLYARQRAKMTTDDVVDLMRKAIAVTLVQTTGRQGDVTGFRITYSADDPVVAQRVTNKLVSLFIDESMRQRTQQSTSTTDFLEEQRKSAQTDLAAQEAKLSAYKLKFLGELPEQQASTLQILSSLQAQLYTAEGALQRAEQQKTYLAAMREQYEALAVPQAGESGPPSAPKNPALAQAEATLLDLQTQLAQAQSKFTEQHPTVSRLKQQIATQQKVFKQLEAEQAANTPPEQKKANAATTTRLSLAEVESRLKAIEGEIAGDQKAIADIQQQIKLVQARLNMTPVREQQLAEITRSYENSKEQYQSLLQKKLQSELASNLEKRQQGEQFRILDPASLPEKAEGQMHILAGGWGLGVCISIGLVILFEFVRSRLHDEAEVQALIADLPFFQIPIIRTAAEVRRRKLRLVFEAVAATCLALAALGSSVRAYFLS